MCEQRTIGKFMKRYQKKESQSGVATVEFAVTAAFFFMMLVAVVAGGHFFWTHNALVEATRRGARYAAHHCPDTAAFAACANRATTVDRVKSVVVYDSPTNLSTPFVANLTTANVTVTYEADYGVANGSVSVKIENYQYTFMGLTLTMPTYQTTVAGESAGFVPPDI
jgi:Flp pilus assembly protein TadG